MSRFQSAQETIISAGIDIGTSTTKMMISRFSLRNTAGSTHVPRIEIVDKEVLYESPIFRTPLQDDVTIDAEAVEALIRSQYEAAGVSASDIETGAVIITGETATKENAREMVHHLSQEAGEFLVATAGPDLEGIIAAKGSGAHALSVKTGKVIANVDIGGGTANIAVFKREKLLGTCTMHVGGRLIEFDGRTIRSISPPVQRLIDQEGWTLVKGDTIDHPDIAKVVRFMAESMVRVLSKQTADSDQPLLLGHEPNWREPVEAVMFSGGVSECMYEKEAPGQSEASYSDIGMMLAEALQQNRELNQWEWLEPDETVRATVLGAGTQTTDISGATIQVEAGELPLKNIPVYKFSFKDGLEESFSRFQKSVQEAIQLYDSFAEGQNFALYIAELPYMGFQSIQRLAEKIIAVMEMRHDADAPIILVVQTDHAKVLGQTLHAMNSRQSIICIDQIHVDHGDYMDIGRMLQSEVVPVVVKTLTFHSS